MIFTLCVQSKCAVADAGVNLPLTAPTSPIRVTFVSPASELDTAYWEATTRFMRSAADDLGIELEVLYSNSDIGLTYIKAKEVLARENKPDYLVQVYSGQQGIRTLALAQEMGVPTVIVNTSLRTIERKESGWPRGKHPLWLFHLPTDDVNAGELLGHTIIQQRKLSLKKGTPINLLALNGEAFSPVPALREQGLRIALAKHNIELTQIVSTNWSPDDVRLKLPKLLERHPNVNTLWCASDEIATAAVDILESMNIKAGTDVVVGGIDGLPSVYEYIRTNKINASLTGHFAVGAWALVLLHDYHHGFTEPLEGYEFPLALQALTANNIERFERVLSEQNKADIDFTRFSKVHNKDLIRYDFTLNGILNAIE